MYTKSQLFGYLDEIAEAIQNDDTEEALQIQSYIYEMLDTATIVFASSSTEPKRARLQRFGPRRAVSK